MFYARPSISSIILGLLLLAAGLRAPQVAAQSDPGDFIDEFVTAGSGGLSNPTGLIFGPDGKLYVSSRDTDEVLRYDGTTGAFLGAFVSTGLASGGLDGPLDLVFGPDGKLYVGSDDGSEERGKVLRYGPTGDFIDVFVPDGSGGLKGPTGLVFGPDGHLYVGSHINSKVLRYDGSTGAFIGVLVEESSGGLEGPQGLVFGPDGKLYVSSIHSAEVLRYDGTTGAFIDVFVPDGSGGLKGPIFLVFGPDGNLYVGDYVNRLFPNATNAALRYDGTTGAFLDAFVEAGSGGLDFPIFLVFGPDGNLYVSSGNTNKVLRYVGPVPTSTAVTDESVPERFVLEGNYPNPFNPATRIRYALPHRARVRLAIYDVRGRLVAVLVAAQQPAGWHEVRFEAGALPSGVYFYRLEAGAFREVRQMLLLR